MSTYRKLLVEAASMPFSLDCRPRACRALLPLQDPPVFMGSSFLAILHGSLTTEAAMKAGGFPSTCNLFGQ